ncbi:MAG: EamA family transporter [Acidobacteria bacterium]|nr:EamA family transporter [Acidobacteriota bacterium]
MYSKPDPLRGYLYIGAATFLWGVSATLGRAAFTGHLLPGEGTLVAIDPLILSQTRTTFTFAALCILLGWRRGWSAFRVPGADLGRFFLLGVLGLAAANFFYYVAIQRTNVATAIILQYTAPVWVLLYISARKRQRPTLQQLAAVALALTGIALLIDLFASGQFRLDQNGVAAALLSAVSFAFYNVSAHDVLARHDRWTVLLYVTGSAAIFWLLINPPWEIVAANYSAGQWVFLAIFAVVSALAPFALYAAGLQHLQPERAMIASCLEPVFSIGLAALALGELVRPWQAAGILLVLVAIIVVELPGRKAPLPEAVVEPID